ncbi:MAG: nucleotidyltransferase domain-containing protein [Alphaproteobacteria bacterium]
MGLVAEISVETRHLKILNEIFSKHFFGKEIWAFGSRIKGTSTKISDLDCVVFNASEEQICNAKEAFEESDIPFVLQILSWEKIPENFKKNIKEKYYILQEKKC